jgi:hypothetical protein
MGVASLPTPHHQHKHNSLTWGMTMMLRLIAPPIAGPYRDGWLPALHRLTQIPFIKNPITRTLRAALARATLAQHWTVLNCVERIGQ